MDWPNTSGEPKRESQDRFLGVRDGSSSASRNENPTFPSLQQSLAARHEGDSRYPDHILDKITQNSRSACVSRGRG